MFRPTSLRQIVKPSHSDIFVVLQAHLTGIQYSRIHIPVEARRDGGCCGPGMAERAKNATPPAASVPEPAAAAAFVEMESEPEGSGVSLEFAQVRFGGLRRLRR
jgi:hypothetical protein